MTNAPVTVDPEVLERVRATVSPLGKTPGGLLPALRALHAEFGYVDPGWVATVADVFNLSRADVHGVLTFYADFRTTPPGLVVVRVCRAEACQAVGGRELLAATEEALALEVGQVSPDGDIELGQVFCLGNCALGPAVEVGGRVVGRATIEDVTRRIAEARA
jgi:formate dehydrogenase subunit gamma